MNVFDLSRSFWDFAFENPEKIKPNHIAMYFFAIEHCNRLGWKEKFGFPTGMAMEALGIKSYNTFISTLKDLVDYGFIKMVERSKNQYSANIIALSKFNKAQYKALDKAFIKHSTKQSESTIQSTVQSIDSINKPIYNNTNLPINNINEAIASKENLSKENPSEIFYQSESVEAEAEERKKVAPKKERNEEKLKMPDDFIEIWEEWKEYRKAKRFKSYAGLKWEQMAVDKLLELSNKNPTTAKLILKQTYENSYQGFFPLKQNSNGITKTTNTRFSTSKPSTNNSNSGKRSYRQILAERLANELKANGEGSNITIDAEICE